MGKTVELNKRTNVSILEDYAIIPQEHWKRDRYNHVSLSFEDLAKLMEEITKAKEDSK